MKNIQSVKHRRKVMDMAQERRSLMHSYDRIKAKEGENVTVTLTPQQRAFLFATASFASEFPHFLVEFTDEQRDELDAFLASVVSVLA